MQKRPQKTLNFNRLNTICKPYKTSLIFEILLYSMKFSIYLLTLWCLATNVTGQSFRNEWIDYSKTYYKFPVVQDRLYRISKASLNAIGLGNIPAQDFQLWRNGEEVAIFTTEETGPLAANGFIEFIGKMNDGRPDTELYLKPEDQVNYDRSYFSDTAWHYLTVNTNAVNRRIKAALNNVASTALAADSFFMHNLRNQIYYTWNYGAANVVSGLAVYSSLFNGGEGWAAQPFNNWAPRDFTIPNLFHSNKGPSTLEFNYSVSGNYPLNRNIQVLINDSLIGQSFSSGYTMKRDTIRNISSSVIKNDALALRFMSDNPFYWENIYLNICGVRYPRRFSFSNASFFELSLPASTQGNHLRLHAMRTDNQPLVIYDLTNRKRYTTMAKLDSSLVLLEPSSIARQITIVNQVSFVSNVSTFTAKQFLDYSKTENQGNFLMITNKVLFPSSGVNHIEEYKKYRSSVEGGLFSPIIYDINELAEQFAYNQRKHPLAIRNFIRYSLSTFATKPRFVLLIGKSTFYESLRISGDFPGKELIGALPTFGTPASDNLLAAPNNSSPVPSIPIGRVSAVSNEEVGTYLNKLKQYEALMKEPGKTAIDRDWKKEALHLIGGDDAYLANIINNFFNRYKQVLSDTSITANVATYRRVNNPDFANNMVQITNRIDSGVGLITYFGHSSSSGIDFGLSSPEEYKNTNGRYPIFIANGCRAGNIFDFSTNRLQSKTLSISDNFIFAKNKGAIAFISNSDLGVINYMHLFTNEFYKSFGKTAYGKSIGEIQQEAIRNAWAITGANDPLNRVNLEQVILHSDPAIIPFPYAAADYTTSNEFVSFAPTSPNVTNDSIWVNVKFANIGKSVKDTVDVLIQRETPDGKIQTLLITSIPNLVKLDSVSVKIGIKGLYDGGTNYIIASIDPANTKTEVSKINNKVKVPFIINTSALIPVFPYDLSIVKNTDIKLIGSTANPAEKMSSYRLQIDTSRYFNSPSLQSIDTNSLGGAITFSPTMSWKNNTVYYWRLSPVSAGIPSNWSSASFLFNPIIEEGSNQSHFFQHLQSSLNKMDLAEPTRLFEFGNKLQNIYIEHGIYPTSGTEESHFSVIVNGARNIRNACLGQSIIFNVFDGNTFKPWDNTDGGRYGSGYYCGPGRDYNFEFYYYDHRNRKKIMDFLDSIPKGNYVVARLVLDPPYDSSYAQYWKRDTLIYGKNKSLYHALVKQGFTGLDSLNKPRTFGFIFRKDDTLSYKPVFRFSEGLYDRIHSSQAPTTKDSSGWISSPEFGPSQLWKTLSWQADKDTDPKSKGTGLLQLYGRNTAGQFTLLKTIQPTEQTVDVSNFSATQYPFMQMRMRNSDTGASKPLQLNYWRLAYDPVADGALSARDYWKWNGDTLLALKDSLTLGIAFKNVSRYPLQATPYTLKLGDANGNEVSLQSGNLKSLATGDTARIYFNGKIDTLYGKYYLKLDINNTRNPIEQTYFNNIAYLPFAVDTLKESVNLLEFNATPGANQVNTSWKVSYEVKVLRYEVLYGTDSNNMQPVLVQLPLNNGAIAQQYLLAHSSPKIGANYYRLKVTDKYGKIITTPAKEIFVRLKNFDAVLVANSISASWAFENEMKVTNYLLQHAWNGGVWNTVANVPGVNNGTALTNYMQQHLSPSIGNNKYRLSYTDVYGNNYLSTEKQIDISLVSFAAKANGKTVQTNWTFSNEINISDYVVEGGQDSTKMKPITTLLPTGNAAGTFNYSFVHNNPPLGYFYYRLRVKDKNGNIVYSPLQYVFVGDATTVIVYPNPFQQELRIVTGDNSTAWALTLYDALGRTVIAKTGTGSVTLNTTLLPKGTYFLTYKKGDQNLTETLQKL